MTDEQAAAFTQFRGLARLGRFRARVEGRLCPHAARPAEPPASPPPERHEADQERSRVTDSRDKVIAEQARELAWWKHRAERAEALVEVQKEVAALLGTPLDAERS